MSYLLIFCIVSKMFTFKIILLFLMPIISISTYSGRTQREKDRLAEAITEDVKKIFNVDKKDVIIVFQEEPHGNWYAEGIRL
jgi:4-oxalocrotonate tautomerase